VGSAMVLEDLRFLEVDHHLVVWEARPPGDNKSVEWQWGVDHRRLKAVWVAILPVDNKWVG